MPWDILCLWGVDLKWHKIIQGSFGTVFKFVWIWIQWQLNRKQNRNKKKEQKLTWTHLALTEATWTPQHFRPSPPPLLPPCRLPLASGSSCVLARGGQAMQTSRVVAWRARARAPCPSSAYWREEEGDREGSGGGLGRWRSWARWAERWAPGKFSLLSAFISI